MTDSRPTILVVDDEVRSLEALERNLADEFDVRTARTTAEAEAILAEEWVHIILCDQRMPDRTGVDFLTEVRERWPDVIRIILSGYTDAEDIIAGLNEAGIYQYITKPWRPEALIMTLRNAVGLFELQRQNELLAIELRLSSRNARKKVGERRAALRDAANLDDGVIRARASPLNQVCETLRRIAPFDLSVLISGEPGVGKKLIARAVHYSSLRWNKPFVALSCSGTPAEALESELFGHRRGAVPGAVQDHAGLFERAFGGAILLEDVAELPLALQVKLMRVLQEGEYRPVGSTQARKVDVRLIASTQKDLETEVRAGRFRQDLYFHLAGVAIDIPPLRERREDIPPLAAWLFKLATEEVGKNASGFTPEAVSFMKRYDWPGNVPELRNEIRRMLVLGPEDGALGADLLSPRVLMSAGGAEGEGGQTDAAIGDGIPRTGALRDRVEAIEARILREALTRHRWNKSQAAKELGLSRVGLRGKLERYGLDKEEAAFRQRGRVKKTAAAAS